MAMPLSSPHSGVTKMKIGQPGEQINSELCHAIFVSHYVWFLFISAPVLASLGPRLNFGTEGAASCGELSAGIC